MINVVDSSPRPKRPAVSKAGDGSRNLVVTLTERETTALLQIIEKEEVIARDYGREEGDIWLVRLRVMEKLKMALIPR